MRNQSRSSQVADYFSRDTIDRVADFLYSAQEEIKYIRECEEDIERTEHNMLQLHSIAVKDIPGGPPNPNVDIALNLLMDALESQSRQRESINLYLQQQNLVREYLQQTITKENIKYTQSELSITESIHTSEIASRAIAYEFFVNCNRDYKSIGDKLGYSPNTVGQAIVLTKIVCYMREHTQHDLDTFLQQEVIKRDSAKEKILSDNG